MLEAIIMEKLSDSLAEAWSSHTLYTRHSSTQAVGSNLHSHVLGHQRTQFKFFQVENLDINTHISGLCKLRTLQNRSVLEAVFTLGNKA